MPDPASFEACLLEIEGILRELEDGKTSLEAALSRYEQGVALLRQCYSQLQTAEQRIQQLVGVTAEGKPELQPFEHTSAVSRAAMPAPTNRKPPSPRPPTPPDGLF